MNVDVIYSINDPVGVLASRILVEYLGAKPTSCPHARECFIHETGYIAGFDDILSLTVLDESPRVELRPLIALSRHASHSCRPTLSLHHTGNPTGIATGGKPYTLAFSYPALAKTLLMEYKRMMTEMNIEDLYTLTLEATHHGPTETVKPIVFVEVGSCEEQWRDQKAIVALARTVYNILVHIDNPQACTPAVAFGGTHYPERFTRAVLESNICLGHIISRHQMAEGLREIVVEQAIAKTYPTRPSLVVVEKSSVKKAILETIINVASRMKIPIEYW